MNTGLPTVRLRAHGPLRAIDPADIQALLDRLPDPSESVRETVAELMAEVVRDGDRALLDQAVRFDRVALETIEVPRSLWDDALDALDPKLRGALERAAENIRVFHAAQMPSDVTVEVEPGVTLTHAWTPLRCAGVYAPGGTASYPSSVLMGVVPARAAGVEEVVVCSPPSPSGRPSDMVLAACAIAGADRLFALGGAGAVAALGFGTETVPRVDAVVGPGNRWVTEAKRQLAGTVVIDAPAGPSELLLIADDSGDPAIAALEMLAQAEHDSDASCVLVTTSTTVAATAYRELSQKSKDTPRAAIARRALETRGAILVVDSIDEAVEFSERYAPEHLSLLAFDAPALARRIRNAGTIFVGPEASVAFGDYMTGANHVLPTAGRGRNASGLSTRTFLRSFTIQNVSGDAAHALAGDVAALARAEGLPAHAAAAAARGRS